MDNRKVVITGLGIVSPNSGRGKDAFSEAIFNGVSGISEISLFDTSDFKVHQAGQIQDFQPQQILGSEGLRVLDRSTKLLSCATRLALDDASIAITENNSRNIGLVVGNTLGSIQSVCDFDKVAIKEGPQYVNPSLFPNTIINAQASHTTIRFNIKGFNTTISTGFSAGLDAISYAADFIQLARKDIVLAAGVEELSIQTFLGFYKAGCLAGSNPGALELCCPFDKRRNGIILGEGSVVLVLENLQSALKRKAKIYASVEGYGSCFGEGGLKRTMQLALENAGLQPRDVDYISSGANSTLEADSLETQSIKAVFGEHADKLLISSVKSMLGESFSASGAFATAAGVCSIEKQMVSPTLNYEQKDPLCDLSYVTGKAQNSKVDNVLINAFSPNGCNTSLIISKFRE